MSGLNLCVDRRITNKQTKQTTRKGPLSEKKMFFFWGNDPLVHSVYICISLFFWRRVKCFCLGFHG